MRALCVLILILRLLLLSCGQPFVPNDTICTVDTNRFGEDVYYFPPLKIPCPDYRAVAIFSYRHPRRSGTNHASTSLDMAVSHDGEDPVDGIAFSVLIRKFENCGHLPKTPEDAWRLEPADNGFCGGSNLRTPRKLCYGTSVNSVALQETTETFVVWNLGGCVGNLTFEVGLANNCYGCNRLVETSSCLENITEIDCSLTVAPIMPSTSVPTTATPSDNSMPVTNPPSDVGAITEPTAAPTSSPEDTTTAPSKPAPVISNEVRTDFPIDVDATVEPTVAPSSSSKTLTSLLQMILCSTMVLPFFG